MIKQRMNREGKGDVTFFFDRMVNFRVDTINMNIYLFLKWPWQKRQLTPSDYIYDARNPNTGFIVDTGKVRKQNE